MIRTKQELKYYLLCDKIALGEKKDRPRLFGDEIWKYERLMRKLDYASNKNNKIVILIFRYLYHRLSIKLGYSIPYYVCGPGLCLAHIGNIIVSSQCRIGENCKIHVGVNIGATSGNKNSATIGDNVYIGPGVKIVGDINIGNNVTIGANAVVVNDVGNNITIAGIPAKKISDNDSSRHIVRSTKIANEILDKN